jgi:hypothetical protein
MSNHSVGLLITDVELIIGLDPCTRTPSAYCQQIWWLPTLLKHLGHRLNLASGGGFFQPSARCRQVRWFTVIGE